MIFTQIDTNRKYPRYFHKESLPRLSFYFYHIRDTIFSKCPGLWNVLVKSAMGFFRCCIELMAFLNCDTGLHCVFSLKNWLGIIHARIQINRVELILRFL